MLVDVLIAVSCGIAGILCGWIAYPNITAPDPSPKGKSGEVVEKKTEPTPAESAVSEENAREKEQLKQISLRLQTLAERLSADVDTHKLQVQSVIDAVREMDLVSRPEAIYEAMSRLLDASESLSDHLARSQVRLDEQATMLHTAEQQAMTDALTQVANRRVLDSYLEAVTHRQPPRPATLMLVDIDHFKRFNDAYGHLAGDEVLRQVSKHLQHRIGQRGMVSRFGGEEFAIVFPDSTLQGCQQLAEQARATIGTREITFEDQKLRVTCSAGMAEWIAGESDAEWLARADSALYRAKDEQRDCGIARVCDEFLNLTAAASTQATTADEDLLEENLEERIEQLVTAEPSLTNLPRCLQGLPVGAQVVRDFSNWAQATVSNGGTFLTVVTRLDQDDTDIEDLRMVARTIRSAIRPADRIGIFDERTLVVGMPHISHDAALQRADRIRASISFSSEALMAETGRPQRSVRIALSGSTEAPRFPDMLEQCLQLLAGSEGVSADCTLAIWKNSDF